MLQTFLHGARQALRLKRVYFVSAKGKFTSAFSMFLARLLDAAYSNRNVGRLEWSSFPLLCLTLPLELNLTAYL